jgi:RHS repeat-associated protein
VKHNFLNLPSQLGSLGILYDATGRKWRKAGQSRGEGWHPCPGNPRGRDAIPVGIEYRDGKLEAIYLPDGRLVAEYAGSSITRYRAEYFHQDHLGNTRLAFSDFNQDNSISLYDDPATPESELEITQEAHYYPFGMGHLGPWYESVSPENRYLYNGKELNDEEGVGLYDFGFRWYDAAYGRFVGVDPISDDFPSLSTFNYAANNPATGIDLHGLQFVNANDAKIIIHNGGASLKTSNLSKPTIYRINTAKTIAGRDAGGRPYLTTSFPTRVGSLNFEGNQLERRRAVSGPGIVTEANDRFGGNSSQRRAQRRALEQQGLEPGSKTTAPVPTGRGGKGMGGIWALTEGLNYIGNQMVRSDLMEAEAQYQAYGALLEAIMQEGIVSGLIPQELQAGRMLGDIANYIFQGEFVNTYDATLFRELLEVSQQLMIENGILLDCDRCQQNQRR